MRMGITIDYRKNNCSKGSVVSILEGDLLNCNFSVRREGFNIIVDFSDNSEEQSSRYILQQQAKPFIINEYLQLCMQNEQTFIHSDELMEISSIPIAQGLVCVCVDGYKEADLYGRLYTMYDEAFFPFSGLSYLLMQMEQIYDAINFPEAAMEHRRFLKKNKNSPEYTKKGLNNLAKDNKYYKNGEKATFIVQVLFRQNATWQGTVTWKGGKQKQRFRSALELIRLINDVSCNIEIENMN